MKKNHQQQRPVEIIHLGQGAPHDATAANAYLVIFRDNGKNFDRVGLIRAASDADAAPRAGSIAGVETKQITALPLEQLLEQLENDGMWSFTPTST